MRPFLLDTNIWAYLYYQEKYTQEYSNVIKHMNQIDKTVPLGISVISWGEIAVGLPENDSGKDSMQRKHIEFVSSQKPWLVGIDEHTAEQYGKLRGRLSSEKHRKKRDLVDIYTWLELGSMENDLWIIAQAVTRDLVLVTNDEKLRKIAGDGLIIENWAAENI